MKTNEVCGRPLDCFGCTLLLVDFLSEVFILVALLPPDYAEATGAAKKIKIKKQTHHAQKQGKSTEGKPFLHASDCNRAASML